MNVEDRFVALERSCRRLRLCCLGLAVSLFGIVTIAATQQAPKAIDAQRITLRDEAGRERAILTATAKGSAGLYLLDSTGKQRLFVGTRDQVGDAGIFGADKDMKERVALRVHSDGTPQVTLSGPGQKSSLGLIALAEGPFLSLNDENAKTRLSLSYAPMIGPGLTLSDHKGDARAILRTMEDHTPSLVFLGPEKNVLRIITEKPEAKK